MIRRIDQLRDDIDTVDGEIEVLQARRRDLVRRLVFRNGLLSQRQLGKRIAGVIKDIKDMQDGMELRNQVMKRVFPIRPSLDEEHYPKVLEFLPDFPPPTWTHDEAIKFLALLTQALLADLAELDALIAEHA